MSWTITGTGTPAHLRELCRRHLHHYNQDLSADERLLVNHLVGHAIRNLQADALHSLSASGHEESRHYDIRLSVDRLEPSELPPPIPEEPPARASDLARTAAAAEAEI